MSKRLARHPGIYGKGSSRRVNQIHSDPCSEANGASGSSFRQPGAPALLASTVGNMHQMLSGDHWKGTERQVNDIQGSSFCDSVTVEPTRGA